MDVDYGHSDRESVKDGLHRRKNLEDEILDEQFEIVRRTSSGIRALDGRAHAFR